MYSNCCNLLKAFAQKKKLPIAPQKKKNLCQNHIFYLGLSLQVQYSTLTY